MAVLRSESTSSWLKGLLLSASVGAFVGILELWFFEFSLLRLFAAAGAGAAFAVLWTVLAFGHAGHVSPSRFRATITALPAGCASGAVWWLIAGPATSIWLAVIVGAVLGTIVVVAEW